MPEDGCPAHVREIEQIQRTEQTQSTLNQTQNSQEHVILSPEPEILGI